MSLSVNIRKALGPMIAKLVKILDDEQPKLNGTPPLTVSGQIAYYEDFIDALEEQIEKIETSTEKLEKKNREWLELLNLTPVDKRKAEDEAYASMVDDDSGLLAVIRRAGDSVSSMRSTLRKTKRVYEQLGATSVARVPSEVSVQRVKLPRLRLQEFDGNPKEWNNFWNGFKVAVDQQPISAIEKLTYLLSVLKGKAKASVEGFAVREENYPIVTEFLTKKYGQSDVIISSLMREFRSVPPVGKNKDFCAVVETCESILRQLEALFVDVESPQIQSELEDKLPAWVLEKVFEARENEEKDWSVSKLRKFLLRLSTRREKVSTMLNERKAFKGDDERTFKRERPKSTFFEKSPISTLATITTCEQEKVTPSGKYEKPQLSCCFCKGAHKSSKFEKYPTAEDKIRGAKEAKLCFKCLSPKHRVAKCRASKIECYSCKGPHLSFMCTKGTKNRQAKFESNEQEVAGCSDASNVFSSYDSVMTSAVSAADNSAVGEVVILMCRDAWVRNVQNPEEKERVWIFFDLGSQRSFIDKKLASRLKLQLGPESKLGFSSFGVENPQQQNSSKVMVGVKLEKGGTKVLSLSTMNYLTKELQTVKVSQADIGEVKSEAVLNLDREWVKPQILIGIDYFFQFMKSASVTDSGFTLIQTSIGLIVAGKGFFEVSSGKEEKLGQYSVIDVDEFWNLEFLGIREPCVEKDDEIAVEQFQRSVSRDSSGRYSVSWPWRDRSQKLSNNYGLCIGRLQSVIEKLKCCPELLRQYEQVFRDQLDQGIIEVAPKDKESDIVHYLPHHAVVTPKKLTTKLRIVFDASAKCKNGHSLNEVLCRGPVMLPNLAGVLLRWRTKKFVLLGDLEKAFLQVGLNIADREVSRFLWVKNVELPAEGDNLVNFRYCRVIFGIISSPFLLGAVIVKHLESCKSSVAEKLLRNLYVDNVLLTSDDESEVLRWYLEVKRVFSDAKMNIREFVSNSEKVQESIPESDRQLADIISVLGLSWNLKNDSIVLKLLNWPSGAMTKKTVLRFIASHFDPLGYLVPVLLPLKLFCQSIWEKKLNWDQKLTAELSDEWSNISKTWKPLEIVIPRLACLKGKKQLHLFVDASARAYALAIYVRSCDEGKISTCLLFAKSRLAPLDGIPIPRAELLAVFIGVRAMNLVKTQLFVEDLELYAWSDSVCAISWSRVQSTDGFQRFVKNRVSEIQKSGLEFRYVPSEENPADAATRGLSGELLKMSQLWWSGPHWLSKDPSTWPDRFASEESSKIVIAKSKEIIENEAIFSVIDTTEMFGQFVSAKSFCSWSVLLIAVKGMLRFIKGVEKKPLSIVASLESKTDRFAASKLAEILLLRQAQLLVSEEEIETWNLKQDSAKLWRVHCRLSNYNEESRFPIYLPTFDEITKLLILNAHEICGHSGVSHTLSTLREKYWIEKGKCRVKSVLRKHCLKCRRWSAKPFKLPIMPDLPSERVNRANPFQHVGVDYAGPMSVKNLEGKVVKKWIVLFTCLVTRAVHLEIVDSQSTHDFLNVFRKFIARRGNPETLLSDNASQFVMASELVSAKWRYITSHAPWQGGVYERLIGLMKNVMRKVISKPLLNETEFQIVVVQVESILNSRPLVQVDDDSIDVLRPVDFLIPKFSIDFVTTEPPEGKKVEKSRNLIRDLRLRYKRTQECLDHFWKLWRSQYFNVLLEKTVWQHKQGKNLLHRSPRVGEVVVLFDEDTKKGSWRLAKVVEVKRGTGNSVRIAKICLPGNVMVERPISHLYSLEIFENETEPSENAETDVQVEQVVADCCSLAANEGSKENVVVPVHSCFVDDQCDSCYRSEKSFKEDSRSRTVHEHRNSRSGEENFCVTVASSVYRPDPPNRYQTSRPDPPSRYQSNWNRSVPVTTVSYQPNWSNSGYRNYHPYGTNNDNWHHQNNFQRNLPGSRQSSANGYRKPRGKRGGGQNRRRQSNRNSNEELKAIESIVLSAIKTVIHKPRSAGMSRRYAKN